MFQTTNQHRIVWEKHVEPLLKHVEHVHENQGNSYPLVTEHNYMEHHCFRWVNHGKSTIYMANFNN